jgi:hypothetical protein
MHRGVFCNTRQEAIEFGRGGKVELTQSRISRSVGGESLIHLKDKSSSVGKNGAECQVPPEG